MQCFTNIASHPNGLIMKPVIIEVSGVLPAPPAALWKLISGFSDSRDYQVPCQNDKQESHSHLQGPGTSRGGVKRTVYIGSGRLCEELTLLDHERYAMRWKLAPGEGPHPFPASCLEYRCSLRLRPVTMSKETFIKLQCSFKTETEMVGIMRAKWQQIYEGMVQSLLKGLPMHQGQGMGSRQLSPAALSSRFSSPSTAGGPLMPPAGKDRLPVNLSRLSANEDHLQGNFTRSPLTLSLYPDSSGATSPERCPAPVVNFPFTYASGGSTLSGHDRSTPTEVVQQNLAALRRASASSVDATRIPNRAAPSPQQGLARWLSLPSIKLFAESIKN